MNKWQESILIYPRSLCLLPGSVLSLLLHNADCLSTAPTGYLPHAMQGCIWPEEGGMKSRRLTSALDLPCGTQSQGRDACVAESQGPLAGREDALHLRRADRSLPLPENVPLSSPIFSLPHPEGLQDARPGPAFVQPA